MSICIAQIKASVNFTTRIKKINSNTNTNVISAPSTSIWIFLNPQLFLSGFKHFKSPSTRYRNRGGIFIFRSGERIKKYPDSLDACVRKTYPERKSCGIKNIRIKLDGWGLRLQQMIGNTHINRT